MPQTPATRLLQKQLPQHPPPEKRCATRFRICSTLADDTGIHTSPAHTDDAFAVAPLDTDYDPADYRWVPVKRRSRFDGWTEEKQRRFIEGLADTRLVSHAAKAVGMSRHVSVLGETLV